MSTMVNEEGLKRGLENYGPKTQSALKSGCECGHGMKDHNARGEGKGCDVCGCGMFHGLGDASGRPDKQKK